MKYLLQMNKIKLIGFFLIDEQVLSLKQKLNLLYHFDGNIDKIISSDFEVLKKILKKKKNIYIDYRYYFEKAEILLNETNNDENLHNFKIVTILDKDYPFFNYYIGNINLEFLPSPVIFYIGNLDILKSLFKISIVGTREPDLLSLSFIEKIIKSLKFKLENNNKSVVTISGFAKGIDYKVHDFSIIEGLPTTGIIGNGINIIYPSQNLFLYKKFLNTGNLLISEYPPDTKPFKSNFPYRNRLISLLGDVLILIQAGIPSGANITVKLSEKLNKEVLIFNPGIRNGFEGNLQFLNSGKFRGFFYIDNKNIYLNKELNYFKQMNEVSFFKEKLGFEFKQSKDFFNIYFADLKNNYYTNNYVVLKVFFLIVTNPYINFDSLLKLTGLSVSRVLSVLTILESEKMIYKNLKNRYYPNYINIQKINKFWRINEK